LLAAAQRRPLKIWEIQLTQIAIALGDENLAGDDATRCADGSSPATQTAGVMHSVQAMKTPKERSEERRQEKLADIQDQVERGVLSIRKMTPAERKENPPKERKPKGSRQR
jgi:anti-sigma28 factor (negative regulator of flagellin synthesis)